MRNFIGLDRAVIGLLVVALGAMLLLDTTDFLQTDTRIFETYWPSLLIVWGMWGFIANGFRLRLGYTIILVLGIGFQLAQLGLWSWDISQLWPLFVVLAGLFLIFRRPQRRRRQRESTENQPGPSPGPNPGSRTGQYRESSRDTIRASHILGGGQERVTSQDFQGGEISAILGGMELDLRDAGLHQGQATLDATVVCGGLELRVPRDWRVNLQTTTLFGGTENRHQQPGPGEAKGDLTITGTVVCGGIEVRN